MTICYLIENTVSVNKPQFTIVCLGKGKSCSKPGFILLNFNFLILYVLSDILCITTSPF